MGGWQYWNDTVPQQWHKAKTSWLLPSSDSQLLMLCPPAPHLCTGFTLHRKTSDVLMALGKANSCGDVISLPGGIYEASYASARKLGGPSLSAWQPIIFIPSYLMGCLQAIKDKSHRKIQQENTIRLCPPVGLSFPERRILYDTWEASCYFFHRW